MKEFGCRDVGMDCDWKTQGQTEDEILQNVEQHAKKEHGFKEFAQDMKNKVMSKIRDIKAA